MRMIEVFQCELNRTIPLEYLGKVKYVGKSFGVDSLTNGKEYAVVVDKNNHIKIVDDSDEDYLYSLDNPGPGNGPPMGKFVVVDDPDGVLEKLIKPW
ncbi:MAG: hypothetical protein QMB63_07350 [Clostridiaceae bacterium]